MIKKLCKGLMKSKIWIALLIVILFIGFASPVLGLKVSGVILEGTAVPGDHKSFNMVVSLDKNDAPKNLTVDVMDWKQGLHGENNAVDSYSSPYSAKDMLTVSPKSFHLEPNSSQKVAVEANIPSEVKPGGKYAIISIHDTPEKGPEKGVKTQVAINSFVLITVSEQDLQRTGEISLLKVDEPILSKELNGSLMFNNTGNVLYRILTDEVLYDSSGKVLANTSVPSGSSVLPGVARILAFSLKPQGELSPGTYTIEASIRLEDGTPLASKSIPVEIKS